MGSSQDRSGVGFGRDREPASLIGRAIANPAEIPPRQPPAARFAGGGDIVREGAGATACHLLLDGFAFRSKVVASGGRQITALYVPGDFLDLDCYILGIVHHAVTALSACDVAVIPHSTIAANAERYPALARELWAQTLVDMAIAREWLVCMGRRSAIPRVAHLLCELFVRLRAVERASDRTFRVPITQAELGDVLGLSAVHINRVVQELRRSGIINWRGDTIAIRDWRMLRSVGDFDPSYLSLDRNRPAFWRGLVLGGEPLS